MLGYVEHKGSFIVTAFLKKGENRKIPEIFAKSGRAKNLPKITNQTMKNKRSNT